MLVALDVVVHGFLADERRLSGSPSGGLLVAKNHASGSCLRNQSVLLVGYAALDVADRLAPPNDHSLRSELRLPDRAKEIDFQFHGSKGFIWGESTCKRHAHGGVRYVAKNPSVQRSHGICMLWSGCQDDRRPSVRMSFASNPIKRAMGTSFVLARSRKSACEGIS
jgi:hypothetical protein